jgi:DNA-binding ferritin-like protein (Dps family)
MLDTLAMASLLKGEYKEAFSKIDLYGSMDNIDNDIYEDRIMNLYDMFVEAQNEGKPVEKIIGNDIEEFCKEYYKCEEKNHTFKRILGKLAYIMTIIFIYSLIDYVILSEESTPYMECTVDFLPVFVGFGIGFILALFGKLINKYITFKQKNIKPLLYYFIVLVIFVVGIIAGLAIFKDINIGVPLHLVLLISGAFSILYYVVSAVLTYKKHGTLKTKNKKEQQERKEFEKDLSFQSGIKDVASGMAFRYKRHAKKNKKKGKEFTQEDFEKIMQKEIDSEKGYNIFMGVIFAIFTLMPSIHEMITNGIFNGIMLFIVLAVIETFIFIWFYKFNKEQNETYVYILKECKDKGISILEFVEQKENEQ